MRARRVASVRAAPVQVTMWSSGTPKYACRPWMAERPATASSRAACDAGRQWRLQRQDDAGDHSRGGRHGPDARGQREVVPGENPRDHGRGHGDERDADQLRPKLRHGRDCNLARPPVPLVALPAPPLLPIGVGRRHQRLVPWLDASFAASHVRIEPGETWFASNNEANHGTNSALTAACPG